LIVQSLTPAQIKTWPVVTFLKKWITDGWLTHGPQIGCPANQVRSFACCVTCGRVFPHWWATMTAAEAKQRGYLGCRCGSVRLQPVYIATWKSVWWFCVRGWLIRKVMLRKRVWDPRLPILEKDMQ
jgi:hypothetical protein